MNPPPGQSCRTCFYGGSGQECRRHAPITQVREIVLQGHAFTERRAVWPPIIDPDTEWCGDWDGGCR